MAISKFSRPTPMFATKAGVCHKGKGAETSPLLVLHFTELGKLAGLSVNKLRFPRFGMSQIRYFAS